MDTIGNGIWILGIVAVLALLALAVWLRSRKQQSYRLVQHFGPKTGHAVDGAITRTKAADDLASGAELPGREGPRHA